MRTAQERSGSLLQYPLLFGLVAFCGFVLIAARRSPKTYRTVVVLVIASMVVVPLMQAQQTEAFFERQAEKQAKQEAGNLKLETAADLKTQMTGNWDPQQDPLLEAGNSKLETQAAASSI